MLTLVPLVSVVLSRAAGATSEPMPDRANVRVLPLVPGSTGELPSAYGLYEYLDLLVDADKGLTIDQVSTPPIVSRFEPNITLEVPLAARPRSLWMRLRIDSELPSAATWWLYCGQWGTIELYSPSAAASGYQVVRSGRFVPLAERADRLTHPYLPMLPIALPDGPHSVTLFVHLTEDLRLSRDLFGTPPPINATLFRRLTPLALAHSRMRVFLEGAFLGVMLALGIYHLILYTSVRESCYSLFGLAALAAGLVPNGLHALHLEFLWPNWPRWDYYATWFSRPLWAIPFFLFFMTYVGTKTHTPRAHRILWAVALTSLLDPLILYLAPPWYTTLNAWVLISYLSVLLTVAVIRARQGSEETRVFLIGFLLLLVAQVGYLFARLGLVPSPPMAEHGAQLGFAAFAVLFGIALAVHIRRLRSDKLLAEHREAVRALELKKHELEAARLTGELSRTRLQALKSQLQPHFLFNALGSVAALMRTDVRLAERKLALLADLLRMSLEEREGTEISVAKEVAFVRRYLDIEVTRFPGRLRVEWQVDSECLDALVPHLVLQPLVENAVLHGVLPATAPVQIAIRIGRQRAQLVLEVQDTGAGASERVGELRPGVGLQNTHERLRQMYGEDATLSYGDLTTGGFVSRVELPFHTTAVATEQETNQR
jgi:hypothetical protein